MPVVSILHSPLVERHGVEIFYRESGQGRAMIHLHGGWGYAVYPFDRQIEAFQNQFRIIIPDRSGYGRSTRMKNFPADFHRRAAQEMISLLDAMEIERAVLWGHSDGAVIAAMMGLREPDRFEALILEAFHLYRDKPGSRLFFETMAENPDALGERVCKILAEDHGEDYWRELILMNGRAWLDIASESRHPKDDLYDGRLPELSVPTLFLHGSRDPRTEPDELERAASILRYARLEVIEDGGHSPHSDSRIFAETNRLAADFLSRLV
ncbi:MAG: alpha/beta hydrolase [Acidobacteriota bacterium]